MSKFYFAEDGNWGSADGLAIVDTAGLDEHFMDYIDSIREYHLSAWAAWFVDNNHPEPADFDGECHYCESYESGSLAEIDAINASEEE
jgi:hypothetical protein